MGILGDLMQSIDSILDANPRRPAGDQDQPGQLRARQLISTLTGHGVDVWQPKGMAADAFLLTEPESTGRRGILVRVAASRVEVTAHDRLGQPVYRQRAEIGGKTPTELANRVLSLADAAAVSLGLDRLSAPPRETAAAVPGQAM